LSDRLTAEIHPSGKAWQALLRGWQMLCDGNTKTTSVRQAIIHFLQAWLLPQVEIKVS